MEGSHLREEEESKRDISILSPTKIQAKNPMQYLQETLLFSNRQNPKKESKEDEEK